MAAEALAPDADAAAEAEQLCVPPIATATPVPGPDVAYRAVHEPLNQCLQGSSKKIRSVRGGPAVDAWGRRRARRRAGARRARRWPQAPRMGRIRAHRGFWTGLSSARVGDWTGPSVFESRSRGRHRMSA